MEINNSFSQTSVGPASCPECPLIALFKFAAPLLSDIIQNHKKILPKKRKAAAWNSDYVFEFLKSRPLQGT